MLLPNRYTRLFLILGAWGFGGLLALIAAFIWAELAVWRRDVGGQYAIPARSVSSIGSVPVWLGSAVGNTDRGHGSGCGYVLLRYFVEMAHLQIRDSVLAAIVLSVLTIINCLGVRAGSTVQSILMVLKIVAIVGLVVCGLLMVAPNAVAPVASAGVLDRPVSLDLLTAIGAAMVPVLLLTEAGRPRRLSLAKSRNLPGIYLAD